MSKKNTYWFVCLVMLLLMSSTASADFWDDEKLLNVFETQTGETLNAGEWVVGIGPLGYGFTDRLMLRTNFFSALLGYAGVSGKYKLGDIRNVTLSVGIDYENLLYAQSIANEIAKDKKYKDDVESIKASYSAYSIFVSASKSLGPKLKSHSSFDFVISDFKWDVQTKLGKSDTTSEEKKLLKEMFFGTNLTSGVEYEFNKKIRGLANLGFDFYNQNPIVGVGIIWAPRRSGRIEVGVVYPISPWISIYWRW